jgi:hypothetical protein
LNRATPSQGLINCYSFPAVRTTGLSPIIPLGLTVQFRSGRGSRVQMCYFIADGNESF